MWRRWWCTRRAQRQATAHSPSLRRPDTGIVSARTSTSADHAWTVGLYRDEEFQHLENPYAPFAEGGPVDDPEMFFGRDELLNRLATSLLSRSGRKSVVMFGQKRAGKSSLIEHLRRRLAESGDVLPVSFSLHDIASDLSEATLLHRIMQGISEALEDLRFEGRNVPEMFPSKHRRGCTRTLHCGFIR